MIAPTKLLNLLQDDAGLKKVSPFQPVTVSLQKVVKRRL